MLYAIIKHLSVSLLKVSFEGFPPLSATLASGVKYNTLPCRSSTDPHQDFLSNLTMTLLRVSPAPAPRSILVKKVTFQRREGESSSGSRLETTFRFSFQFQSNSGGSLGASQSGYLDMASLREDIAGTIVREPPPYPRYFGAAAKIIQTFIRQESDRFSALDPLL